MARVKVPVVEGLVTSDAVQAGATFRKRLAIVVIVVVALAGLAVSGWYVWTRTSLFSKPTAPTKTSANYSNLSPADALIAAQNELKRASTSEEKAAAYSNLGQAYMRNDKPSQAVSAYQNAIEQSGSGSGSSSGSGNIVNDVANLSQLADAYAAAGDTANAIKTLQKLIDIVKSSNEPTKDRIVSRYEAEISYLQGHAQ